MSRVTVEDLKGLLGAIDVMSDLVEGGAEDPLFLAEAEGAANCRRWVLNEIHRRERKKRYRHVMKQAKAAISETNK